MNEIELLKEVQKENPHAWAELVHIYGPGVYKLLVRFSSVGRETDDLYQEVFLRVYQKIHTYNPQYPFRPWLMKLAVNVALNHCKRLPPRQLLAEDEEIPDTHCDNCRWETMEEVHNLLKRLAPEARMVFLLYHYHGYSVEEITSMTQMPIGTVKSHLRRSRLKLSEWVAGKKEGSDGL